VGGIVWLASFPKSGNTWMRAFLLNLLYGKGEAFDINNLYRHMYGDAEISWYQRVAPESSYDRTTVQRLRPLVHQAMAQSSPQPIFVKTHNALMEDDGHPLVAMDVTAAAIYIVRDPLDVAISYSHHNAISIDAAIESLARRGAMTSGDATHVYEIYGSWSENVLSWTQHPNPGLHVVRYEDMLEAPTRTFSGVVKFLGLDVPRAHVEKAIKLSSFKVLKEQERRHGFVERPAHAEAFFREGKAGQWKAILTRDQVAAIVGTHREQMARFGYVPSGH
jgi:Sulfotransferase domain